MVIRVSVVVLMLLLALEYAFIQFIVLSGVFELGKFGSIVCEFQLPIMMAYSENWRICLYLCQLRCGLECSTNLWALFFG